MNLDIWRREGRPWLLERLRLREWNQADLARRLDVPQATVSRWVNAQSAPSAESAEALAGVFGVDGDTVRVLAGIQPRREEPNPVIREVVATLRQLPPEEQAEVRKFAQFRLWTWQRDQQETGAA